MFELVQLKETKDADQVEQQVHVRVQLGGSEVSKLLLHSDELLLYAGLARTQAALAHQPHQLTQLASVLLHNRDALFLSFLYVHRSVPHH